MIKESTMENQSLTSNWEYGTLEDAVNKGSSNISLNKVKEDDGEYKLYSAKGYNKNISFFHQEKEYLAIIKDGAGIGRVSKHPAKSSVVATMQYLIPKEGFDIGFVQYFLNGIDFESHRQGSTIPHVYFKDYKSELFPLLPLPQQKQIVASLNKAFSAIDIAKANAQQNLQNVKELFESYLQNVFKNKGDDWKDKKWRELCHFVRGPFGGSLKKSMFKDSGYVVYEQKHAIHNHFNQLRYFIDEEKFNEMKRFEVKPGDIIMSCSGVTLGRVAIIPDNIPQGIINQALLKLTPNKEINVEFLKHWLRSNIFQTIIFEYSGGAAIPNVPAAKILKEIIISTPNIKEQKRIVSEIELTQNQTKKLEAIYTQKIADLEEMKKSVLQKAFSGQLNTVN